MAIFGLRKKTPLTHPQNTPRPPQPSPLCQTPPPPLRPPPRLHIRPPFPFLISSIRLASRLETPDHRLLKLRLIHLDHEVHRHENRASVPKTRVTVAQAIDKRKHQRGAREIRGGGDVAEAEIVVAEEGGVHGILVFGQVGEDGAEGGGEDEVLEGG